MDRLRCLEIFAEVARGGSFTAAAQRFAVSRSAVSKHVAWLLQSLDPTHMVAADLAAGRLVSVLAATPPTGLDIYVVYPARNNLPKRVRTFLDHLRDWARSPPD